MLGYQFDDLNAKLRIDGDTWRIDVSGPQAQGLVALPDDLRGSRPIVLEMKRLFLVKQTGPPGEDDAAAAAEPATDPRTLPAINLRAEDFAWQGRQFGQLQAVRRQGSARPGAAGAGDVSSGVLDRRARRLVRRERQYAHADRTGTDQYGSCGGGARPRLSRFRRSPQSPLHGKPELGRGAFCRHPAEVERHDAGCTRRRSVARCRTRRGPHARPAERRCSCRGDSHSTSAT